MDERLTSPAFSHDDAKSDALLRPRKLEEFVGKLKADVDAKAPL